MRLIEAAEDGLVAAEQGRRMRAAEWGGLRSLLGAELTVPSGVSKGGRRQVGEAIAGLQVAADGMRRGWEAATEGMRARARELQGWRENMRVVLRMWRAVVQRRRAGRPDLTRVAWIALQHEEELSWEAWWIVMW